MDATILSGVDWPVVKALLIALRKDAQLTPAQLAQRMGVPRSTITRIENLRTRRDNAVDLDTIELWTRAVSLSLISFFELIASRAPTPAGDIFTTESRAHVLFRIVTREVGDDWRRFLSQLEKMPSGAEVATPRASTHPGGPLHVDSSVEAAGAVDRAEQDFNREFVRSVVREELKRERKAAPRPRQKPAARREVRGDARRRG